MTPASLISGQGAPTNANTNIDARFWLQCRLMLATSLGGQDDSGGKLGDFVNNATKKIGTCTYHIKQGIKECDAFGYTEMECQFKLLAKTNDIKAGADGLEIVKNLEVYLYFYCVCVLISDAL